MRILLFLAILSSLAQAEDDISCANCATVQNRYAVQQNFTLTEEVKRAIEEEQRKKDEEFIREQKKKANRYISCSTQSVASVYDVGAYEKCSDSEANQGITLYNSPSGQYRLYSEVDYDPFKEFDEGAFRVRFSIRF